MTKVVDASVLVAAQVESGHDGAWAVSVIAEGSLIAPELVLVEASNSLRRLERSRQISEVEAALAYGALLRLEIELFPFAPFADRVWELRGSLTCYDAWYVAMAESFDCPLATLDLKLSRASGPMCKIITAAGSRPSP